VGLIVRESRIVKKLRDVFERDWATTSAAKDADRKLKEEEYEEAASA
jgi:hypothetical protein